MKMQFCQLLSRLSFLLLVINTSALADPTRNHVFEIFIRRSEVFSIRATASIGKGGWIPPGIYVFESTSNEREQWKEIFVLEKLGPTPIPTNHIQFIGETTAFIFMGWIFASTTDSGKTWSIWDARKDLPGYNCCPEDNYIASAYFFPDGTGKMFVEPNEKQPLRIRELFTKDYGRHWTPVKSSTAE